MIDLVGEVARLRSECDLIIRRLDVVDGLPSYVPRMNPDEHEEVMRITHLYTNGINQHLQHVGQEVNRWYYDLKDTIARMERDGYAPS
jgi:hypothetical protein